MLLRKKVKTVKIAKVSRIKAGLAKFYGLATLVSTTTTTTTIIIIIIIIAIIVIIG